MNKSIFSNRYAVHPQISRLLVPIFSFVRLDRRKHSPGQLDHLYLQLYDMEFLRHQDLNAEHNPQRAGTEKVSSQSYHT